jgi:hypothetical protein
VSFHNNLSKLSQKSICQERKTAPKAPFYLNASMLKLQMGVEARSFHSGLDQLKPWQ